MKCFGTLFVPYLVLTALRISPSYESPSNSKQKDVLLTHFKNEGSVHNQLLLYRAHTGAADSRRGVLPANWKPADVRPYNMDNHKMERLRKTPLTSRVLRTSCFSRSTGKSVVCTLKDTNTRSVICHFNDEDSVRDQLVKIVVTPTSASETEDVKPVSDTNTARTTIFWAIRVPVIDELVIVFKSCFVFVFFLFLDDTVGLKTLKSFPLRLFLFGIIQTLFTLPRYGSPDFSDCGTPTSETEIARLYCLATMMMMMMMMMMFFIEVPLLIAVLLRMFVTRKPWSITKKANCRPRKPRRAAPESDTDAAGTKGDGALSDFSASVRHVAVTFITAIVLLVVGILMTVMIFPLPAAIAFEKLRKKSQKGDSKTPIPESAGAVVLIVLLSATPASGKNIVCTAGNFTAGATATVTFYFPDYIDNHDHVYIKYRPSHSDREEKDVLQCSVEAIKTSACEGKDGFVLKGYTRNTITIEIPNVTAKAAGRYISQFLPPDDSPREMCKLTVQESVAPVPVDNPDTTLEDEKQNSSTEPEPGEAGTVNRGAIAGGICGVVVLVIGAVVVCRCIMKKR